MILISLLSDRNHKDCSHNVPAKVICPHERNFNLLFIIDKPFLQVILFIQTFSSGNTLYFLHHQIETFCFFAGTPNLICMPRTT
jgi:hypothetical protein